MHNSHMMHKPSGFPLLALKQNNQVLLPESFTININENKIYVKTDAGLIPMDDLRYVGILDAPEIEKHFDSSVLEIRAFDGRIKITNTNKDM